MVSASGYIGRAVLLYDGKGEYVKKCEVSHYEARSYHLRLRTGIPQSMAVGEIGSLLILCEPSPHEYQARVIDERMERVLLLFRGKEKESRRVKRYKVAFTAKIMSLIRDGEIFALHRPVAVQVVNISRTGLRLRATPHTLRKGDKMHLKIELDATDKLVTALAVNELDINEEKKEFGCRLVSE